MSACRPQGDPGLPVLRTLIHRHPLELTLPFAVGSEFLDNMQIFERSFDTLKGDMFSLKLSLSTPASSPDLLLLCSVSLDILLLPALAETPPSCISRSLSLNWRLLVPRSLLSKPTLSTLLLLSSDMFWPASSKLLREE